MRNFTALFLALTLFVLAGCSDSKTINGVTYTPYGLLTQDNKSPCVSYHTTGGNIFWVLIGIGGFGLVPLYILGWDLYEPVGAKPCEVQK